MTENHFQMAEREAAEISNHVSEILGRLDPQSPQVQVPVFVDHRSRGWMYRMTVRTTTTDRGVDGTAAELGFERRVDIPVYWMLTVATKMAPSPEDLGLLQATGDIVARRLAVACNVSPGLVSRMTPPGVIEVDPTKPFIITWIWAPQPGETP